MPSVGNVLLVGSVPLADSEAVFTALATELGTVAPRYPDGETGERLNWIRWQHHVFADNPDLELIDPAAVLAGYKDSLARPFFAIREGVDVAKIRFKPLGYAAQAAISFAAFSRLKRAGIIPSGTRFQVSIPTVVDLLSGFVGLGDRAALEPALEEAMRKEIEAIVAAISNEELAIQWDFCQEVLGYDGGYELHYGDILDNSVARVGRLIDLLPAPVQVGVHLCYGDPGHRHVIEPSDARTCVSFANAMSDRSHRIPDWIHIPIPRNWLEERYYSPLAQLRVPETTEVFLGLIHKTDGVEGTSLRIKLARQFLRSFGVATECGFGRRDPRTLPELLAIHRAASVTLAAAT